MMHFLFCFDVHLMLKLGETRYLIFIRDATMYIVWYGKKNLEQIFSKSETERKKRKTG